MESKEKEQKSKEGTFVWLVKADRGDSFMAQWFKGGVILAGKLGRALQMALLWGPGPSYHV